MHIRGLFKKTCTFQPMLGKIVKRPTKLDRKLVRELLALADKDDPYETITGTTMCALDFYEGKIGYHFITHTNKSIKLKRDDFQARAVRMVPFAITVRQKNWNT